MGRKEQLVPPLSFSSYSKCKKQNLQRAEFEQQEVAIYRGFLVGKKERIWHPHIKRETSTGRKPEGTTKSQGAAKPNRAESPSSPAPN